jgi:hypothetical protein
MQWNERANKNCPKRVPKHLQDPKKTQFHKKLVNSVKIVNAQFLFPCFKLQTVKFSTSTPYL